MAKTTGNKRNLVYIIALVLLAAMAIFNYFGELEDKKEYKDFLEHAVTVTATVEDSLLQFRDEIDRDIDGERITKKVPYYTYVLSYTYEGKQYRSGYGGYSYTHDKGKGTQIEVMIDSRDPDRALDINRVNPVNFTVVWLLLTMFAIVLFVWLIDIFIVRRKKKRA